MSVKEAANNTSSSTDRHLLWAFQSLKGNSFMMFIYTCMCACKNAHTFSPSRMRVLETELR